MAKFVEKRRVIEATQWFKNGDHPSDYASSFTGTDTDGKLRTWTGYEREDLGWEGEVVRYFRHPEVSGESPCHCGRRMHDHGWIEPDKCMQPSATFGLKICPGAWIIKRGDYYDVISNGLLKSLYEPVVEL